MVDEIFQRDGRITGVLFVDFGEFPIVFGAAIGWLVSRWRRRDPAERTALAEVTGGADDEPAPTDPAPTDPVPTDSVPAVPDVPAPADAEPAAVGTPIRAG